MQHITGAMRRAIEEYHMIAPGDHIAVGVSGGKDSLALLCGLCRLREYLGVPFSITAVSLDPCFEGEPADYAPLQALCAGLQVPLRIQRTDIGNIIFQIRREQNPCSLCARMRRGALHDICNEIGAGKLALGHNWDDAVETFVMNLFQEGRLGCFSPVTYLSRKQITVIRPLVYAAEKDILGAARREGLPVMASRCPADKNTQRERVKQWLSQRDREDHGFSKRLFGAMKRAHISGW